VQVFLCYKMKDISLNGINNVETLQWSLNVLLF